MRMLPLKLIDRDTIIRKHDRNMSTALMYVRGASYTVRCHFQILQNREKAPAAGPRWRGLVAPLPEMVEPLGSDVRVSLSTTACHEKLKWY